MFKNFTCSKEFGMSRKTYHRIVSYFLASRGNISTIFSFRNETLSTRLFDGTIVSLFEDEGTICSTESLALSERSGSDVFEELLLVLSALHILLRFQYALSTRAAKKKNCLLLGT